MKPASILTKSSQFEIACQTAFGRHPKISDEQSWNMITSDNFQVPYAGFKKIITLDELSLGRGIFYSARANVLFAVVGDGLYVISTAFGSIKVGTLATSTGDVFMDENNAYQIAVCDKQNIYIYNYSTSVFSIASFPTTGPPGYVTFQDGRFIAPALNSSPAAWYISALNDGTSWGVLDKGLFQTKGDQVVACVRFPARGNMLFVMGTIVTESWFDQGISPFPYVRSSSYNIDYGCLNSATIAAGDSFIVWLGSNDKSGPVIMYSNGGEVERISNDGLDYKFSQLTAPQNSFGFLFKQDGHLIYQITFYTDNLTYAFDFNTKRFFSICDENMNYHPARHVAFFNNSYYFVSANDGNLYELSTNYTDLDYGAHIQQIPRILIPKTLRAPDNSAFIIQNINFTLEQGEWVDVPVIDFSISLDGGETFGNSVRSQLNNPAVRRNRMVLWVRAYGNEFTPQLRFWGFGRFVIGEGQVNYYQ